MGSPQPTGWLSSSCVSLLRKLRCREVGWPEVAQRKALQGQAILPPVWALGLPCHPPHPHPCLSPWSSATLLTLIRWIPASMRSCSTSFRAWAMLLVADIVCHQLWPCRPESCGGSRQREPAGRPQHLMEPRMGRQKPPPTPILGALCSSALGTGHVVCVLRSDGEARLNPSLPTSLLWPISGCDHQGSQEFRKPMPDSWLAPDEGLSRKKDPFPRTDPCSCPRVSGSGAGSLSGVGPSWAL